MRTAMRKARAIFELIFAKILLRLQRKNVKIVIDLLAPGKYTKRGQIARRSRAICRAVRSGTVTQNERRFAENNDSRTTRKFATVANSTRMSRAFQPSSSSHAPKNANFRCTGLLSFNEV